MTRLLSTCAVVPLLGLLTPSLLSAQNAASPSDSVSIRPTASRAGGPRRMRLRPDELEITDTTLRELIAFAYQRHPFDDREVTGGPAWLDVDRFDVLVKVTSGLLVDARGMPSPALSTVRMLLADRFALDVREESRERPAYVLKMAAVDGALGPKIRRSEIDCGAVMRGEGPPLAAGQGPPCGFKTPPGRLIANTFPMPSIASLIARHVGRPVIDQTGLDGRFDIELEASEIKPPPGYQPGPSDLALPPAAGPPIAIAVREQLGLTLEAREAPVPVLVVHRADRLSPK